MPAVSRAQQRWAYAKLRERSRGGRISGLKITTEQLRHFTKLKKGAPERKPK